MWKVIADLRRVSLLSERIVNLATLVRRRSFLSETYSCQEAWERRLKAPVFQNIKLDEYYQELDSKFRNQGKASAIDIDLFANLVKDESYIDELEDLLHKLRLCPNTTDTLPSTHHCVIRYYLAIGKHNELLHVLNDRLNYGIFPDDYCFAMLMDTFLKESNYTGAAKVAVLEMLQEDWSNPVVSHLALYSCHMYLKNPGPWEEQTETEPTEDDKEEIKVRVKFIRNPYFDDHFDLHDPKLLVGKTLATLGATFPDAVGKTYELIGWGMYQKWDKVISHLVEIISGKHKPSVFKEGIEMFKETLKELEGEDASVRETKQKISELLNKLDSLDLVTNESLDDAIEKKVNSVVSSKEKELIEEQRRLYSEWEVQRETLLQEQLAELDRQMRLAKVKEEKENLAKREEVIFFFDNEEKWELQIEKKKYFYKKRYFGKKKKPRTLDENYIPPEVTKAKF